jgi:hypothetical protein
MSRGSTRPCPAPQTRLSGAPPNGGGTRAHALLLHGNKNAWRSQRAISQPSVRVNFASTVSPRYRPSTSAMAGPASIWVQTASPGVGAKGSARARSCSQAFSGAGCVPPARSQWSLHSRSPPRSLPCGHALIWRTVWIPGVLPPSQPPPQPARTNATATRLACFTTISRLGSRSRPSWLTFRSFEGRVVGSQAFGRRPAVSILGRSVPCA